MKLYWNDIEENKYLLGELYKKDNYYYFKINEDGLGMALKHGCFGIGKINILEKTNKSEDLFEFFKNRIPREDSPNIDDFLKSIGLEEYDEYEILKRTGARLLTDRYFLLTAPM